MERYEEIIKIENKIQNSIVDKKEEKK
jgi:hypothetical protein